MHPADARNAAAVLYSARFSTFSGGARVTGYLPVMIFLGLIVAFGVVSLVGARVLRPARPYFSKLENYECGAEPIGTAWVQFPVGFYLVALIFIVFDALAVFLFPWALVLRGLGLGGVGVMALFMGILGLGWVYALREGILEWK
jgi:NADH-quinone oxidoreductase subunit A